MPRAEPFGIVTHAGAGGLQNVASSVSGTAWPLPSSRTPSLRSERQTPHQPWEVERKRETRLPLKATNGQQPH